MLALRVVIAWVLVVLGGSFTSQIEMAPTLTDYPVHDRYTVLNVEI